jgi:hypothetical protein
VVGKESIEIGMLKVEVILIETTQVHSRTAPVISEAARKSKRNSSCEDLPNVRVR